MSSSCDALAVKEIPGSYGFPLVGPIKDRVDYYYKQGQVEFFMSRMKKYKSTVFRVNAPPGPFMAKDSRVVILLDAVSFPILFDTSKVDKRNLTAGTFMPSTHFTGGYRVCAFLDPSEPNHALLKPYFLSILERLHTKLIPIFRSSLAHMFDDLEADLAHKHKADFNPISDKMSYDFLFQFFGNDSSLDAAGGNANFDKWLFFQLAPLMTLGFKFLPNFVEDLLLHTFPLPSFLVKSGYEKVHCDLDRAAGQLLDEAEWRRDEASHSLMFFTSFNAYDGMKILFLALMKYVGLGGAGQGDPPRREGERRHDSLERMSLVKSVVWEALRMEPLVESCRSFPASIRGTPYSSGIFFIGSFEGFSDVALEHFSDMAAV